MSHWIAVIIGAAFVLFQLVYAFIIIYSLIENTGYTVLSIIAGICHAASPVVVVIFGYQCLLRKAEQYGMIKAAVGVLIALVIYFFIVSIWNRIVLGETPEMWMIGLLTLAQVIISVAFVWGFLHI